MLEKFGAAEDPLLPGHLLLEQYQAQFVSALRCIVHHSFQPLRMVHCSSCAGQESTSTKADLIEATCR